MDKFDPFSSINNLISGEIATTKRCHLASSIYLEEAPNELEFIEGENFLGAPTLFPVQYEIVRDFFELLCPQCNDVERIHTLNDIPREDQILF
jgi:hypothetical protein